MAELILSRAEQAISADERENARIQNREALLAELKKLRDSLSRENVSAESLSKALDIFKALPENRQLIIQVDVDPQ